MSRMSLVTSIVLKKRTEKQYPGLVGSGMHRGDMACRGEEVAALVVDRRVEVPNHHHHRSMQV